MSTATTNVVDAEVEDAPFDAPVKAGLMVPASGKGQALIDRVPDVNAFCVGFGRALWQSAMFGITSHEMGTVFAMAMLTENLTPFEIKRRYHIIKGNLTMRADAMLAEFRAKKGGDHEIIERTPEKAEIEIWLPRRKHHRFAIEFRKLLEGKEAFLFANDGKLRDNWSTPWMREQMLWARVTSMAVRAVCPEIVAGVYSPEEIGDVVADVEVVAVPAAAAPVVKATVVASAPAPSPEPAAPAPVEAFTQPPAGQVTELQIDASKPAGDLPKITREQLAEMSRRKKEMGMSDDTWKKLMGKFGAMSAKDLSFEEADRVVAWLLKKQHGTKPDELSQWAQAAAGGQPAA